MKIEAKQDLKTNGMEPPKMEGKFPARLHVLVAREAKVAVVIRRGPSKSVCTVLWDRRQNKFKLGQWMRGRIYERRCDLSPDGKWMIYFAMNGKVDTETRGAWTAISRVPYLKAVNLYGKGDCWHGGGLFTADNEFWLNEGYGHKVLRELRQLRRNEDAPEKYYGGECLTVYYNRLQRDGWVMQREEYQGAVLFEKKLPKGWVLRKWAFAESGAPPGRGVYWDAHELRHAEREVVLVYPEWEWADWVDGRLVWADAGKLCTGRLSRGEVMGVQVLKDFNEMKFEAKMAPY